MPIFISYSHEDSEFVNKLAANLVKAKHHVWIDQWELSVGDSLTQKIQDTLTASSAILVVLSKSSVQSEWCKRELTAGLVRELEERQTLVLPVVVDDCNIPLFLKDKLYADFRSDPDKAFNLLDQSLRRISNATTSRVESPEFFTDFATDWKPRQSRMSEETWIVRWTFLDHGKSLPYALVSECKVYKEDGDVSRYNAAVRNGRVMNFARDLLNLLIESLQGRSLRGYVEDNLTRYEILPFRGPVGEEYVAVYSYRRIGLDNGMDTVVHLDNNLTMAQSHYKNTILD